MPRKTLALVFGLVLVTIILFVIALRSNTSTTPQNTEPSPTLEVQVSPSVPANTTLTLSPNPVSVQPGKQGSVEVNIDSTNNEVTAVQLEIAYDPNFITNVQVKPGPLFETPVLLINKNNVKEGRYTYAFGIMPNRPVVQGIGVVATITFTALNNPGKDSQLALLPTTLVTARGVSESVLKSASGTLIQILGEAINNPESE